MSLTEIKTEIARLPEADLADLAQWFEELQADAWDRQMARDVKAGRFDAIFQRVEEQAEVRSIKRPPHSRRAFLLGYNLPITMNRGDAKMSQQEQTDGLSELTRRGLAIYEQKLKAVLEPEYNNQFIAIHPDSEDYTIADSTGNAMRAMRKIHATGRLLLMKIGPEPEYGLAARILASDMVAGSRPK